MRSDPVPFGGLLGIAPGGVPAYSSDYDSVDESQYPNRQAFRHQLDGLYIGYKWQCVEFARRWLYLNTGCIFDDVGMAYEIFNLRHVTHVESGEKRTLTACENGSERRPEYGGMLIWAEGGEFERTGHVAIITEVTDDYLRVAEQNVDHQRWPTGCDYSRELRARVDAHGQYWVQCSFGDAEILGWMIPAPHSGCGQSVDSTEPALLELKARQADTDTSRQSGWLNIANDDEQAYLQAMGAQALSLDPTLASTYFCISRCTESLLSHATNELHAMFMHATHHVLQHPELLARFQFPDEIVPRIQKSWDNRLSELITSRFDFALTTDGLKVYEYNCDSASCYMETGKIQGKWSRHYHVPDGRDAGEQLSAALVKTWKSCCAHHLVHILRDDDDEEAYHALYMQDIIRSAGINTRIVIKTDGLSFDDNGQILDEYGDPVRWVWKTWAWETALDQLRAELAGEHITEPGRVSLADVLFHPDIMVYEPLWSLIPSNKAILPVLWDLYPDHPLLLRTEYEITEELRHSGYVTKPIVGRCGANIALFDQQQNELVSTGGRFDNQEQVVQALFPLPCINNVYVQLCTFTAAGRYAGAGTRVDTSMVINKQSDCLALRVVENNLFRSL